MAKLTGRSKTFYMQQAITDKLQDMEDLYLAQQIDAKIESGEEKTISWEEVKAKYGVSD